MMRLITLLILLTFSISAQTEPVRLIDMRVLSTPDFMTQLVFDLSEPVKHEMFTLHKDGDKPDRVVIDLENVHLVGETELPETNSLLRKVRSAERNDTDLRIVLDVSSPVKARTLLLKPSGRYGHRLVVTLEDPNKEFDPFDTIQTAAAAPATPQIPRQSAAPRKAPPPPVAAPRTAKQAVPQYTPPPAPKYTAPAPRYTAPVPQQQPVYTAQQSARYYAPPAQPQYSAKAQTPKYKPAPQQVVAKKTKKSSSGRYYGRDVVVAVDAGHGGIDPGAIGTRGSYEKHVVLALSRELAKQLNKEPGMRAVLIRDGDYFLRLRERIERARRYKADVFLSIHADAYESDGGAPPSGASVYMLSQKGASSEAARWLAERENRADLLGGVSLNDKSDVLASILLDLSQTGTLEASATLGSQVLGSLRGSGPVFHRNVQQAAFMVLRSPDIPSILVETAFISNPNEEHKLNDHTWQRQTARSIMQGLRGYFTRHAPPGTLLAQKHGLLAQQ